MATTTLKIYILKPLLIINTIFCINITAKNCYSLIKITVNTMTPIISLIDALAQVDSIINFNSMIYIYIWYSSGGIIKWFGKAGLAQEKVL